MADDNPDRLAEYRQFSTKCRENLDRSLSEYAELHHKSLERIDVPAAWIAEVAGSARSTQCSK